MRISVVIPARNAGETLAETLDSLVAQTHPTWEAIVVDDGSTDSTAEIARDYAGRDERIRTVSQPGSGMGGARNTGLGRARFEWLLFLDSDDWITPPALATFAAAAGADDGIDALYCRWARVAPGGHIVEEPATVDAVDFFPVAARFCPIPIHACVVRRRLVQELGGFDDRQRLCADWDLWQRLARTGARFHPVPEVLAHYRMRPGHAVSNPRAILLEGLEIIDRGHGPDPRVARPLPRYAQGMPMAERSGARLRYACWQAGILLGAGGDARPLLETVRSDHDPDLPPADVAHSLFRSALLPGCHTPDEWGELWSRFDGPIGDFLGSLESQAGARGLACRARGIVERLALRSVRRRWPSTVGRRHGVEVELTRPITDVASSADWLECGVRLEGEELGSLELPICDGLVPRAVLEDALAGRFAWPLLGRLFDRTLYPRLEVREDDTGSSVWRGDICLAKWSTDGGRRRPLHDAVGWAAFLQELWGRPDWLLGDFYEAAGKPPAPSARRIDDGIAVVEVSEDLVDLEVAGSTAHVEFRVGGAPVAWLDAEASEGRVPAALLIARLTAETGFELCCVAVREALVGQPLEGGSTLRERLICAAKAARIRDGSAALPRSPGGVALAPGWSRAVSVAVPAGARAVVFARHLAPHPATSASRRAAFPLSAGPALLESATAAGEPVIRLEERGPAERLVYAPDLFWSSEVGTASTTGDPAVAQNRELPSGLDRHYFETVFQSSRDPWDCSNDFEQLKYEQTLSLLPRRRATSALELACAEGIFTARLASRARLLLATDISQIALDRAAERCAGLAHVRFARLDFVKEPLPGKFDLIVCSEVLYYLDDRDALAVAGRKIADGLRPGGLFLTAHCNVLGDDPTQVGLDWDVPFGAKAIGEVLSSTAGLTLRKELRTPFYRVQLFKRSVERRQRIRRLRFASPQVVEARSAPLPPRLAARFRSGGQSRKGGRLQALTCRLPILMYHQIAPSGSPEFARYRLAPQVFEEQLRYLRDAGFRGITLDEWRESMQRWEPLTGRAVILTFDDGYMDFEHYAWPLLRKYEFSALVFVVADRIGATNAWDEPEEPLALLGWEEIRRLQDEGVVFGSHSASHPFLTALSPADVAREAARSRATLTRGLGRPVTAFAYPHGAEDEAIQHLVGACGFVYGLSCRSGPSRLGDPLLALPRIEVTGADTFAQFIGKLGE